jgi:hypothetical protein
MKQHHFRTLALAACLGSLGLASVDAQAQVRALPGASTTIPVGPFLLRFDENFNATISVNGGPPTTLVGTLAADPAVPVVVGLPLALTFMLPEPVVSGDVSFTETAGAPPSDWLRFTDAAGNISGVGTGTGSRMLFYSNLETGETNPLPADHAFPENLGSGLTVSMLETGVEGNNGFDYRPGGVAYPNNNEYIGISDPVPEPETYALMLAGLGVVSLAARRRRASKP